MVVESSATGLFRTLLVIGGVLFLLHFLGQFMIAKRNVEGERKQNQNQQNFNYKKRPKNKSEGKIKILGKNISNKSDIQDVDFEELD